MTSNPQRILQTLDQHLSAPVTLHLYGRAALALGFRDAAAAIHATMDVDAILPSSSLAAFEADEAFWDAQEKTNTTLGESGLYFTHLFAETQVILTPGWLGKCVAIDLPLAHLQIFRLSIADLILTKMMRIDPQDREDLQFLLHQPALTLAQLHIALEQARLPAIPEIQEAFDANKQWLLAQIAANPPTP